MSSNPSPSSSVSDTRPTSIVVSEVDTNAGAAGAQIEATLVEPPTSNNSAPPNSSVPSVLANDDFSNLAALRKSVPDLATGQMFGRYRIESLLGRGGMGAVYRAYDTNLQRTVALKVPFFKQGHSDEIVKRFLREARAVAQLSHPHLCRIFDVGAIDGVLFLTMEFVEGQSLDDIAPANEPLENRIAIPIVMQIALALQDAHERGIVHRDLKPANIMLNGKGQAILMDFGLARNVDGNEHELTSDGALLGTPSYMSPEQAQGDSNKVGPASDIYSLGVVLYRLLSGRRPFEGRLTVILNAISTQNPRPPREHNPGIAPELDAVCLRAMAKSPGDRFGSAKEFAEALAPFAPGMSIGFAPATGVVSSATAASDETEVLSSEHGVSRSGTRESSEATTRLEATASSIAPKSHDSGYGKLVAGLCVVLVAIAVVAWKPWDRSTQTASPSSPTAPANQGTPARNDSESANSSSTAAVSPPSQALDQKPAASLPVVAADATLEIHLQRAEQESGYEVLGSKSLPLSKQDKVQLHVRLSGPSFAYVFWIDTDGACLRLWPETSELLDRERQQPVRELWLPPKSADNSPKQKMFFLDDSSGLETVLVATSPKPLGAAELRAIEMARVDLAHFDAGRKELASFRSENWRKAQPDHTTLLLPPNSRRELVSLSSDQDRGIGGVIETVKNARPIDDFSKRLNDVFGSYTAVVFSHE